MSFLNLAALWVAALAVPALLILYFLKLRRREEPVATTLLWKRAVQDLQVNAPFQRLRRNLLLLLQLLILALAILALARPVVETEIAEEERVVLLIDQSASMNTREEDGQTRLDLAKEQAVRLVRTLNQRSGGWSSLFSLAGADAETQCMVIAFADRASIVSPFTSNTADLEDLIRRIKPTDRHTDLQEAFKLAEAYMAPPTMYMDTTTPFATESPAKLVVISDGRVANLDELVLQAGTLERMQIGAARDNVGITALRTQRNYERPEVLNVYLTVENFGPETVNTEISIYVDGTLDSVEQLPPLAPAQQAPTADEVPAPEAAASDQQQSGVSLSFSLTLNREATIEARLAREDDFMVDNSAWAVIPPPRKLSVLVVTRGNALLDAVLAGLPLREYPFIRPDEWEANPNNRYEVNGQATYDVVIFDKYQPQRFPTGNYLFLKALPPLEGFASQSTLENHALIWWDETHPVLRHVALEYVYVGESLTLEPPDAAEILVEGPDGPSLFRYARDGRHSMVLTFAIEDSNWWSKQSFPAFVYNTIRYLGGGGAEVDQGPLRPGEPLRIPAPADAEQLTLIRPDGQRVRLQPDAAGVAYYAGTDEVGVYRVEEGVPGRDRFALNLESELESNVAPPAAFVVEGEDVQQLGAIRLATPEVWRWFVGAALVLLLLEWWVYNRRVMI